MDVTHSWGDRSTEERSKSSTWRELHAVGMVLESLIPKLKNERICWVFEQSKCSQNPGDW